MPLRGEADRKTYTNVRRIAGGAVADDVYLAQHGVFNEEFVQKVVGVHGLEDGLAANEPEFLNRLRHPNIVEVREAQWDPTHERAIVFVMPKYAGGSVDIALREDYRFSLHQAVELACDRLRTGLRPVPARLLGAVGTQNLHHAEAQAARGRTIPFVEENRERPRPGV